METNQIHQAGTEFPLIVRLIESGDPLGEEMLYATFHRGLGYIAQRECPEFAADCVHETFLVAIRQIRMGQVKDPLALAGYIRTVLKRTAWKKREEAKQWRGGEEFETVARVTLDNAPTPEQKFESGQKIAMMKQALQQLRPKEQEILERFYLKNERPEAICTAMKLTDNQFRLLKSRSKQKLQDAIAKATRQSRTKLAAFACAG